MHILCAIILVDLTLHSSLMHLISLLGILRQTIHKHIRDVFLTWIYKRYIHIQQLSLAFHCIVNLPTKVHQG